MWTIIALLSAVFAGITTVLCKIGMRKVSANTFMFFRTLIVFVFAIIIVLFMGRFNSLSTFTEKNYIYLGLSSLATCGSWFCYYHAIKSGEVNKVAAIDKLSVVLTMVLAIIFLNELGTFNTYISMVCILLGTLLILSKPKNTKPKTSLKQYFLAILSCIFASINNLFAKIGLIGVDSNLATAFKTLIVVIVVLIVMLCRGEHKAIKTIKNKTWLFIFLAGLSSLAAWLLYYAALQHGQITTVIPIDKLSVVFTVILSIVFLKEKITKLGILGLFFIVIGALLVIL